MSFMTKFWNIETWPALSGTTKKDIIEDLKAG